MIKTANERDRVLPTEDFLLRHLGQNHYVIIPNPAKYSTGLIAMTGSAVEKIVDIPFFHRITKLRLVHHSSTIDTLSTDNLTASLSLALGNSSISPHLQDDLFSIENFIGETKQEQYGEGFEFEARKWTLSMNTTNGDYILPLIYIQKLGEGLN